MQDRRIIQTNHNLGIIKIIPGESEFPWGMFTDGEINCAYQVKIGSCSFNDIRIWLDKNATKTVFLLYNEWAPCKFAFTAPDDAATFALKFGDVIERLR